MDAMSLSVIFSHASAGLAGAVVGLLGASAEIRKRHARIKERRDIARILTPNRLRQTLAAPFAVATIGAKAGAEPPAGDGDEPCAARAWDLLNSGQWCRWSEVSRPKRALRG